MHLHHWREYHPMFFQHLFQQAERDSSTTASISDV